MTSKCTEQPTEELRVAEEPRMAQEPKKAELPSEVVVVEETRVAEPKLAEETKVVEEPAVAEPASSSWKAAPTSSWEAWSWDTGGWSWDTGGWSWDTEVAGLGTQRAPRRTTRPSEWKAASWVGHGEFLAGRRELGLLEVGVVDFVAAGRCGCKGQSWLSRVPVLQKQKGGWMNKLVPLLSALKDEDRSSKTWREKTADVIVAVLNQDWAEATRLAEWTLGCN